MSDPDLTRSPGTIAAMVSMAAVHVLYCTGGRNAVIVAPQVCDSLSWDVRCLECSLKTSQNQCQRVQATVNSNITCTQGPLAVTPGPSLAVYCSVSHIPLFTMGGHWHSWGVYFQDGALVKYTNSIIDANSKNAQRGFHVWDSAVMAIVFFIIMLFAVVVLSVVLSAVLPACLWVGCTEPANGTGMLSAFPSQATSVATSTASGDGAIHLTPGASHVNKSHRRADATTSKGCTTSTTNTTQTYYAVYTFR